MKNQDILEYHSSARIRGPYFSGSAQRAISARIDHDVICELDLECAASGQKRNGVINKAVHWYITELDEARRARAHAADIDDVTMNTSLLRLLMGTLSSAQLSKLHHIAVSLNISVDELVERLVHKLLDEYDRKPFAYL